MFIKLVCILIIQYNCVNAQFNPHFLPNRTGIVHLFEWKFKDIASECINYLAPNGFGGVQISPVTENAIVNRRPWWERYQPISYKIVTRSGTESDFIAMVDQCNSVGVRIYVDTVINHMAAGNGIVNGTGGSQADVSSESYPAVPYSRADFHKSCAIVNYMDAEQVRNCQLVGLPDLNQTIPNVREKIVKFLNKLVDFGVAGFRIDASKHMWPEDLSAIYRNVKNLSSVYFPKNTRPFVYQEVIDFGSEAVKKTEYMKMGAVTEFRYSLEIGKAFSGNNPLHWLISWGPVWGFLPSNIAIAFVDNHDNQRSQGSSIVLSYKRPEKYKMAVAFMLAHPFGIPRVMSSFDFLRSDQGPPAYENQTIISPIFNQLDQCVNGWICEHRWPSIKNMISFRNEVGNATISRWWDNENNQIAFCRGQRGFIAFNNENTPMNITLSSCLPKGHYCDVISGSRINGNCTGNNIIINDLNVINVKLPPNGILALHTGPQNRVNPKNFKCMCLSTYCEYHNCSFKGVRRNVYTTTSYFKMKMQLDEVFVHIIVGQKPLLNVANNYRDIARVVVPFCNFYRNKDSNIMFDIAVKTIKNYTNIFRKGCPFKANELYYIRNTPMNLDAIPSVVPSGTYQYQIKFGTSINEIFYTSNLTFDVTNQLLSIW